MTFFGASSERTVLWRDAATLAWVAALCVALAACGGGASGSATVAPSVPPATAATAADVEKLSADTAVVPTTSTDAISAATDAVNLVVSIGQVNVSLACAGGGTAVFQVSGAGLLTANNGRLDAGETITATFTDCRAAAGQASVTGVVSLQVASANTNSWTGTATFQSVVVSLPRGTVTLNGSATVTRTVDTNGAVTATTTRWQTPNFTVATAFGARRSTFSYTAVDRTRTVTTTNGIVTSTSHSGSSTLSLALPGGSFNIVESSTGAVSYDVNGLPAQGTWSITLPNNRVVVTIAAGVATVSVDWGNDGGFDRVYTFQVSDLSAAAG